MDKLSELRVITSQTPTTHHNTHTPYIYKIHTLPWLARMPDFDHIHEHHEYNFGNIGQNSNRCFDSSPRNTPQSGAN